MLLIGLNIYKGTEPTISYSIGVLAAELRRRNLYFEIADIDLSKSHEGDEMEYITEILWRKKIKEFNWFAISVFSWSDFLVNRLIRFLKTLNPKSKIVLGGPQITYSTNFQLLEYYPEADYFIKGYGEQALADLYEGRVNTKIIVAEPDYEKFVSPYNEIINIKQTQGMIRVETKRGCPYRCAFCAHFDKSMRQRVKELPWKKNYEELLLIKSKNVKKINVLDPVFNIGKNYQRYLRAIGELDIKGQFVFQTRFELMNTESIELFSKINCKLEFGLQSAVEREEKAISRPNNHRKIKSIAKLLQEAKVPFEVSIIYGLPTQTYDSFLETIDFLNRLGIYNIEMFPLGILRGTPLDSMRDFYQIKTMQLSRFDTPVVISSSSFNYKEWEKMHTLAKNYKTSQLCKKSLL